VIIPDEKPERRPGRYECSPFINGTDLDGSRLPQNLGSGQSGEDYPRSWGSRASDRNVEKMKGKLVGESHPVWLITIASTSKEKSRAVMTLL
jgi:hypothetical protein